MAADDLAHGTHVSTLAGGRAGSRDGNPQMAAFCFPVAIAVDGADVWIAEGGRSCLRVLRDGLVSTVHNGRDPGWAWATTMGWPGVALDAEGAAWVSGWTPTGLVRLDGMASPA